MNRLVLRVLSAVVVGVLLASMLWLFGADALAAFGLGLAAMGFVLATVAFAGAAFPPTRVTVQPYRAGTRDEVVNVAHALRPRRSFLTAAAISRGGQRALREHADRRLAATGLRLDEPTHQERIVALIGVDALRILTAGPDQSTSLSDVERVLNALATKAHLAVQKENTHD